MTTPLTFFEALSLTHCPQFRRTNPSIRMALGLARTGTLQESALPPAHLDQGSSRLMTANSSVAARPPCDRPFGSSPLTRQHPYSRGPPKTHPAWRPTTTTGQELNHVDHHADRLLQHRAETGRCRGRYAHRQGAGSQRLGGLARHGAACPWGYHREPCDRLPVQATAPRPLVEAAVAKLVAQLDYSNFKSQVAKVVRCGKRDTKPDAVVQTVCNQPVA